VARRLRDYLTQERGWQLDREPGSSNWLGSRYEGNLLDRHEVFVRVKSDPGPLTLNPVTVGDNF
jgi:hypothetical protein